MADYMESQGKYKRIMKYPGIKDKIKEGEKPPGLKVLLEEL